jgi:hypothetical protein
VSRSAGSHLGCQPWYDRVERLNTEKLHTSFMPPTLPSGPIVPRFYTLTHSDTTGDLYLTIGPEYNRAQTSGWYTRLMRDEVFGEWREAEKGPALHVHCHVSGGWILGFAGMRDAIFRRELPLALEALRFGDGEFLEAQPGLDEAPVFVHFHAKEARYNRVETWGVLSDYR